MLENRMVVDGEWVKQIQPRHIHCCTCDKPLYYSGPCSYPDTAYYYDGEVYCEDCFLGTMKELYEVKLEEQEGQS